MSLEILATLASSSLKAAFKDYVTDPWNAMDIAVLVLSWWWVTVPSPSHRLTSHLIP
jgi:hypothetical protein